METMEELRLALQERDEQLQQMQRELKNRNDYIESMRSLLDKYQSIMPQQQLQNGTPGGSAGGGGAGVPAPASSAGGPRKQRAHGISAEPQPMTADVATAVLTKYSKPQR